MLLDTLKQIYHKTLIIVNTLSLENNHELVDSINTLKHITVILTHDFKDLLTIVNCKISIEL